MILQLFYAQNKAFALFSVVVKRTLTIDCDVLTIRLLKKGVDMNLVVVSEMLVICVFLLWNIGFIYIVLGTVDYSIRSHPHLHVPHLHINIPFINQILVIEHYILNKVLAWISLIILAVIVAVLLYLRPTP